MATEYISVDISKTPDLLEVVEEVHRTNKPCLLRRADEELAIISPVKKGAKRSPFKRKSPADMEAFLSSAGGWKDVDTDRLKADIYESRRLSTKPRPDL